MKAYLHSVLLILAWTAVARADYDPLLLYGKVERKDLIVEDKIRLRSIPVLVVGSFG